MLGVHNGVIRRKGGAIAEKALKKLVDWQIAEGTPAGALGTTGESPTREPRRHKHVTSFASSRQEARAGIAGPARTRREGSLQSHAKKVARCHLHSTG